MKAELGLDGALDCQQSSFEHRIIKCFNHLSLTELAEIAATFAGWAEGVTTG